MICSVWEEIMPERVEFMTLMPHIKRSKIKKHLNIEVFSHNGAGYCQGCSEITIIGQCGCSEGFIQDIAGSDLRKSIRSGDIFPMADINMQYFLKSINLELLKNDQYSGYYRSKLCKYQRY